MENKDLEEWCMNATGECRESNERMIQSFVKLSDEERLEIARNFKPFLADMYHGVQRLEPYRELCRQVIGYQKKLDSNFIL